MERIHEILLRKNFPHIATLQNNRGEFEQLSYEKELNLKEVLQGMAELNKNGIVLLDINAGVSPEGITKIADVSNAGLYLNNEWILEPKNYEDVDLPEVNVIPFKSDSWVLGEFIVRYKTGKSIPKRFLKSQKLLDTFCESLDKPEGLGKDTSSLDLKKLLVLDPNGRSFTWELAPSSSKNEGCSVM